MRSGHRACPLPAYCLPTVAVACRALTDDFLQNNGTPSNAELAPSAVAEAWSKGLLLAAGDSSAEQPDGEQPATAKPNKQQLQQRSHQQPPSGPQASASNGSTLPGGLDDSAAAAAAAIPCSRLCGSACTCRGCRGGGGERDGRQHEGFEEEEEEVVEEEEGEEQSPAERRGGSPTRRGGIPLPLPVPAPAVLRPPGTVTTTLQQHLQQQLAQQQHPATPATPGSSTVTPPPCGTGPRHSASFRRSASVDSDNPSLGFGVREVLLQLRLVCSASGSACALCDQQASQLPPVLHASCTASLAGSSRHSVARGTTRNLAAYHCCGRAARAACADVKALASTCRRPLVCLCIAGGAPPQAGQTCEAPRRSLICFETQARISLTWMV